MPAGAADPDLDSLVAKGFQVEFVSHARAILSTDFPEALKDICGVLDALTIPIEEIIAGGGGEAQGTQRLRRALTTLGWPKTEFVVRKTINGKEREAISHWIDHSREYPAGVLALEIEWNNKDPFFDRDLENFKRLHADGAISAGIIVTRGRSLQDNMRVLVHRFVQERQIRSFADLEEWGYEPTSRQRKSVVSRTTRKRLPLPFDEAFVSGFVSDKFGQSTTHWSKLETRVARGVGNPCPLLLIGLPDSIVTFHEGKAALAEVLEADEEAEEESGGTAPETE
jgi:hypothetical protein